MNDPTDQLTERELEVCHLVARLKSASQIALELGISVRTVENHIYSAARLIPGRGQPMKRIIRFFSRSESEYSGSISGE